MTVTSGGAPVDTEEVKLEVPVLGFTDTQTTTNLGEVSFAVPAAVGYLDLQILDATVRVASNFPKSLTLECQSEGAVWVGGITVDDDGITYYTGTAGAIPGPEGPQGPAGPGVPAQGTTGQVLVKRSDADYDTEWVDGPSGNPQYIYGDASIIAGMVTTSAKVTMLGDSISNDTNTTFTTFFHAAAFSWKPEKWGGLWHNIAGAFGPANNQAGAVNPVLSIPGDTTSWSPGLESATAGYGRAAESAGTPSRMFDIGFSSDNLSTAAADHNSGVSAKFGDGYGCFQNRGGARDIATSANQARLRYVFNIGNDVDYVPDVNINLYNPGSTLNSGFQTTAFTGSGRRMEVVDAVLADTTDYTGSEGGVWQGQVRSINNTERLAVEKQFFGGTDDGFTLGYLGDGGWRTRNHYPPGETISTSNGTQPYHYDGTYLASRLAIEGTTHAFIFLGMNDISGADRDGATTFADLQTVISNTKIARPGVKIVLVTPYNGVLDDAGKIQAKNDLQASIVGLASTDPDVCVFDLRAFIDDSFIDDAAFHAAWLDDNTHPNTTGALAMMERFWAAADEAAFPPAGAVDSVNGKTGAIVLTGEDIDIDGTTPITINFAVESVAQANEYLFDSGHGSAVLSGGEITQDNATQFTVAAGEGFIITQDGVGQPWYVKKITWPQYAAQTPTYGLTGRGTNIAIDTNGLLVQSPGFATPQERRTRVQIGQVYHPEADGQISAVQNASYQGPDAGGHVQDLFRGFGKINIEGNTYAGFGGLGFTRSSGTTMSLGANVVNDIYNPNFLSFSPELGLDFRTVTQLGDTGPEETTFNPDLWDNAGTLEPTPGIAPRWTNTYFYLFDTGQTVIMRGQTTYLTEFGARNGIATEDHNTWAELNDAAIFRCILTCISTATDLTDPSQAIFHEIGKFGTIAGASSGVSVSMTDLTDTPADPPTQSGEILEWDGSVYQYTLLSGDNIPATGSGGDSIATAFTGIAIDIATLDGEKVDSVGEGGGTDPIANIVSCTQTEYDALTPVATTVYLITGP